jgi:hypothetical protein
VRGMRRRRHAAAGWWVAAAVALWWLLPASAGAATQLGQVAPTPVNCTGSTNNVQLSVNSGTAYEVPSAGVITSWSHQAKDVSPGFAGSGRLQIWRPLGGTSFSLVGRSELAAFSVGLNELAVRIPVSRGDLVGFRVGPGTVGAACEFPGGAGLGSVGGDPTGSTDAEPGETRSLPTSPGQLNVAAILEPDCDDDGLGDETQEVAVDCVAAETTITKAPKGRSKKRKAKFEFSGTDARAVAGFQCSLDSGSFTPCASPYVVKVRKGKHTFSVRATDQAGNVDPTPATAAWKVKKKRKRH